MKTERLLRFLMLRAAGFLVLFDSLLWFLGGIATSWNPRGSAHCGEVEHPYIRKEPMTAFRSTSSELFSSIGSHATISSLGHAHDGAVPACLALDVERHGNSSWLRVP